MKSIRRNKKETYKTLDKEFLECFGFKCHVKDRKSEMALTVLFFLYEAKEIPIDYYYHHI